MLLFNYIYYYILICSLGNIDIVLEFENPYALPFQTNYQLCARLIHTYR